MTNGCTIVARALRETAGWTASPTEVRDALDDMVDAEQLKWREEHGG